jgi:hypothetical protein
MSDDEREVASVLCGLRNGLPVTWPVGWHKCPMGWDELTKWEMKFVFRRLLQVRAKDTRLKA